MADATTEYLYPSSWTNLTNQATNYASGFPSWGNQVYENWYQQPLSTGETPWLQQVWGNMLNPDQQWLQGVVNAQQTAQSASPLINQAANMYTSGASYDPNQLQQYLNPYTQQAAQSTLNQLNQNFSENVVPGLNSTFTGAGQFGSTRNADFMNRAMRDLNTQAADVLAKANYGAYDTANKTYLDWANLGQTAASGLGSLAGQKLNQASQLGSLAGTGGNLLQQNIANQLTAAQNQQQLQQQGLTSNYQDWLTQQQFPLATLGGLSSAVGGLSGGVKPNVYQPTAQPDNVSRVLALVQAASAGLNDQSIQSIINSLWPEGGFSL